jgi:signal transduction histidine kinase
VAAISSRRLEEQDNEAAWHAADLRDRTALLAATGENAHEQLAAARTALTMLAASQDHLTELTPEDQVQLLAEVSCAVDQVSRLVDDLRDLSRLHAGAVETYLRPGLYRAAGHHRPDLRHLPGRLPDERARIVPGPAVVGRLRGLVPPGVYLVITDGEPTRLIEAWTGAALAVVADAVHAQPPHPGRVHRFVVDRPA